MKIRHGLRDLLFDVSDITNIPSVNSATDLLFELTFAPRRGHPCLHGSRASNKVNGTPSVWLKMEEVPPIKPARYRRRLPVNEETGVPNA
jgi:hypothetical protein